MSPAPIMTIYGVIDALIRLALKHGPKAEVCVEAAGYENIRSVEWDEEYNCIKIEGGNP